MRKIGRTPSPWLIERNDRGTTIFSIGPISPEEYAGAAWLEVSEEDACVASAAPDMLTALETVLAGGHLNTGEQAIVANAIAKATGRDVADVVKGA